MTHPIPTPQRAPQLATSTHQRRWFAMGSDIHVIVHAEHGLVDQLVEHAQIRITELESMWSRFRSTSEISRLNSAGGVPVRCSSETVRLVELLVQGWWVTDGAFDPTLLASLVGLGYHSSRSAPDDRTDLCPGSQLRGRPDGVLVDPVANTVQLPSGTLLDPGGLGKGLAADLVLAELVERGAKGALVSVGGDLAVAGTPEGADAWCVEVQPDPNCEASVVRLRSGGVASSSTRLRTWTVDGAARHHILNPNTGRPTEGAVVGAAVIAGSAATAEAFTKCAFVDGFAGAIETYQRFGLAARMWLDADEIVELTHVSTGAWADFEAEAPASTNGES